MQRIHHACLAAAHASPHLIGARSDLACALLCPNAMQQNALRNARPIACITSCGLHAYPSVCCIQRIEIAAGTAM
jgi:hypothetical protein